MNTNKIKLIFIIYISLSTQMEVKYVALIFRHGDRTPVASYPRDPWNNESFWPVNFGELTNIGKQQHYQLGKWIREHYYGLLSLEYKPHEIYVRSSDMDRTIMSAQANLAGIYPPVGKSIWNSDLMWQPVPVHTVPSSEDNIIAMEKHCAAYNDELYKIKNSKKYKAGLSKYYELMNYLSKHTGESIKDYDDINYIYNVLQIEHFYNFTLPGWTKLVFPNKMREPACYSFFIRTLTTSLSRLRVGPLLKEILTNMKNFSHTEKPQLKMSIYSGHDLTVADVLNALNLFDGNCPVYTSSVIMELLYENKTNEYFIRILYRNFTTIRAPYVLSIPHCTEPCPLNRFINLYENIIPHDWESECRSTYFDNLIVQSILILSMVVVFSCFMQFRRDKIYYDPVYV